MQNETSNSISDTELYILSKHRLSMFYNGSLDLSPNELKNLSDFVDKYTNYKNDNR